MANKGWQIFGGAESLSRHLMTLYSSKRCLQAGKFLSMEDEFGQLPGRGLLNRPGSTPREILAAVDDVNSRSAPGDLVQPFGLVAWNVWAEQGGTFDGA